MISYLLLFYLALKAIQETIWSNDAILLKVTRYASILADGPKDAGSIMLKGVSAMDYLKPVPKSDLILLMEIIHELMISRSTRSFKCGFKKLQNLFLYDGSICILSDRDTLRDRKPLYRYRTMNFQKNLQKNMPQDFIMTKAWFSKPL